MRIRSIFAVVVVCLLAATPCWAINNPLITLDENGNGSVAFPAGGGTFLTTGVLAPDPGPGGLPLALTYNLLGPPDLIAGDLLIFDSGGPLSDVVRFNPAGTAPSYPASAVFYSQPGGGDLADTGFPTSSYANTISLVETSIGGGQFGVIYTPTSVQPGFIPGFSVTYRLVSSADAATQTVPEPATIGLGAIAMGALAVSTLRRRRGA